MSPYILVILCVLALVAGQIMFKIISGSVHGPWDLVRDVPTLTLFIAALILYGVSTIAWIMALRSLSLGHAYMFMALGFILVPIAAHFLLGEEIGPRLLLGGSLILAGVWLANT